MEVARRVECESNQGRHDQPPADRGMYDLKAMLAAAWLTAAATLGLLIGAAVAATYAIRAFGKPSREVTAIERQVKDQAEQLDLQRQQLDEQRKVSERQTGVLDLQVKDLEGIPQAAE